MASAFFLFLWRKDQSLRGLEWVQLDLTVDQIAGCPDATDHQHSAAHTPLGVHHFQQREVSPAAGGWGGPERALHPAESEIPGESPLPVTAPTALWACSQPNSLSENATFKSAVFGWFPEDFCGWCKWKSQCYYSFIIPSIMVICGRPISWRY